MNTQSCFNWILHDYLQVNGGAERVVTTLARELPGFKLAVSGVYRMFSETGNLEGVDIVKIAKLAGWLPRIPRALFSFSLPHDFVKKSPCAIYSGFYAPLSVRFQSGGKKIYYCHTPPRFAFDREEEYVGCYPSQTQSLLRRAISKYRLAYVRSIQSMDVVISNSEHIRKRLLGQTGMDSMVIHPPIDTESFRFLGQQDYYVSLARLEPNKRVEIIVRAFLDMPDRKLIVVSGGSMFNRLKTLANSASNIVLTGWVKQERLAEIVGNSIAAIYIPRDEDFGMAAVEAMAAGKPVVCTDEGGLKESVVHGITGIMLSPNPTPQEIINAVSRLTPGHAAQMRHQCENQSLKFNTSAFISAFKRFIEPRGLQDSYAGTSFQ